MINENIHTMKQPELGKHISRLRKQKGLTQEELVEKCNINVRTIQRIEAGEVNPRSYTLKTILNVLDIENYSAIEKEKLSENIWTREEIKKLHRSWTLGIVLTFSIVYLLLSFYI